MAGVRVGAGGCRFDDSNSGPVSQIISAVGDKFGRTMPHPPEFKSMHMGSGAEEQFVCEVEAASPLELRLINGIGNNL